MPLKLPTKDDSILKYDEYQTNEINHMKPTSPVTITNFNNGWEGIVEFKQMNGLKVCTGIFTKTGSSTGNGTELFEVPNKFLPKYYVPVDCALGNTPPYTGKLLFWIYTTFMVSTDFVIPENRNAAQISFSVAYE